jgi:hypothetical protein
MFVKYSRCCLWILVLATVAVAVAACKQRIAEEPSPLDNGRGEKPLLLEEEPPPLEGDNADPLADNSRCHVCHINYEDEELAVTHARAGVGCERCHGASDAHCSDEDNITPPDIMYPPDKVNSSCKSCHPEGKLGGGKKYCTDCHGEHRLSYRTRKWDKETGQLIEDDKVRMLTD